MATPPSTDIRGALRATLRERMVARDRVAVEALRLAIGAVENAEARPVEDHAGATWSAMEDAPPTAEVARRHVSEQEARSMVTAEADELDEAAARARHLGRPDAADRASQQADVLRRVLESTPATSTDNRR